MTGQPMWEMRGIVFISKRNVEERPMYGKPYKQTYRGSHVGLADRLCTVPGQTDRPPSSVRSAPSSHSVAARPSESIPPGSP